MKKVIFLIISFIFINSINCFSQSPNKSKNVFKSNWMSVYGHIDNFGEPYYLKIAFEKVINLKDTSYYMLLDLSAPSVNYNNDICLNRKSSIKYLGESGKFVEIRMTNMSSIKESETKNIDHQTTGDLLQYQTALRLQVTKDELVRIGYEPFYRILLPYFICSTKETNTLKFVKPAIFTRRALLQKIVQSLLDV